MRTFNNFGGPVKKKSNIFLTIVLVIMFIAAGAGVYIASTQNTNKEINMENKRVLIAYFSHSGNTKSAAAKISEITGGDLFEIKPVKDYPKDYSTVVEQAKLEKENDTRPELVDNGDVKNYDIIFIGTPVWWYTMAPPVKTFLMNNDFEGKIVVPFCTHGGGGASSTYDDMKKLAPNARVTEGYTSYEKTANTNDITKWINNLNL